MFHLSPNALSTELSLSQFTLSLQLGQASLFGQELVLTRRHDGCDIELWSTGMEPSKCHIHRALKWWSARWWSWTRNHVSLDSELFQRLRKLRPPPEKDDRLRRDLYQLAVHEVFLAAACASQLVSPLDRPRPSRARVNIHHVHLTGSQCTAFSARMLSRSVDESFPLTAHKGAPLLRSALGHLLRLPAPEIDHGECKGGARGGRISAQG